MKKILLLVIAITSFSFLKAQTNEKPEAMRLVTKNSVALGLSAINLENVMVSDTYFDNTSGTRIVYLQQTFKGIPVYNQLLVLAFKAGELVSKSGSHIASIKKKVNVKDGVAAVSAAMAVQSALLDRKLIAKEAPAAIGKEENKFIFGDLGISRQNITASLTWVPAEGGRSVTLAWQVYVIPVNSADYWMIRVDASKNNILGMDNYTVYCNWDTRPAVDLFNKEENKNQASYGLFDYMSSRIPAADALTNSPAVVNSSSYRVIPYPAESPIHPGGTNALVLNPWLATPGNATSLKWNSDGTTDYTITRGNNVWAQEDRNNNNGIGVAPTATTAPDPLVFDFAPNFTIAPTQTTPVQNQQFNTTNLFYWNNIAHDITYQYGFDEVSGNFQANNQGRGGNGGDLVLADAQDGGGTNNANFSTPPDGSSGRMQMYLWNGSPQKDGDVDNGVMVHEFGHGISNRLTGGPSNSGCLGNAEQMGEGWSDYYGLMYTQNWATSNLNTGFSTPRGMGTYVIGQGPTGTGIRNQKYCTNFAVNNEVYAASISAESHNRGEIWCATLWDMTWNIINQVGNINPNLNNPAAGGGNSIALKLVTEGMKLQPCSPGFIDGRDAILQADQILYNGLYDCAIREAFRRRGMGAFASQGSSGSVTDQIADYTAGGASMLLTQNGMTQVAEGGLIAYTNTVTTSSCAPLANFLLTDTLPTNVSYVSGGTYNAGNRVVSFPVNLAAGQTQAYTFTVQVNAGAYFPTVTLFEDNVPGATIPATWTRNSTTAVNWEVSNARSHSAPNSYYSLNQDVQSDQKLFLTNAVALGATPPPLSFWHWYSTESTYDGGVVEISTDGGTVWTDLGPHIIKNGYIGTMDASTIIPGRRAWTGSSNNKFIKTKVDLTSYANQSVKIRFRFTSDVGTNLEGWYIDDIAIKNQAVVEMQTNFFTAAGVRVALSDTITIITAPVVCNSVAINAQPSNTNVCAGSNASFTVAVDGTTPAIQWQVSIDGGTNYTDIPGETGTTLTLTGVTVAMNNNMYRVTANNSCPSTISSNGGTLSVSSPASITAQPVNFTVCAGTDASFSITTNAASNTYQWQVSTDNGVTFIDIPGAITATLSLTAVTAAMNNNQYHVVVASCSPAGLISDNVTLTVNSLAAVVTQPSNITACATTDAVFTVVGGGTNIGYQWQVSTDNGVSFTNIPGATAASYTITGVTAALNNNQYHVIITNLCNNVTSANAVLTISNVAAITAQPTNTVACTGDAGSFTVVASGTGYQWQESIDNGVTFTDIPGAITLTLTLPNVTVTMNGNQYHLVVSTCGAAPIVSANATLTVNVPVTVTTQPVNSNVCEGGNTSFSVTAAGTAPVYQWEVSTDGGTSFNAIPGATSASLNLTAVTVAMNGNIYRVVVSNFCTVNFTSNTAILSVSGITVIDSQAGNQTLCDGSNAVFPVTASGNGLAYQWQVSTNGGTLFTDIAGATSSVLTISPVSFSMDNNLYHLVITGCNTITSDDYLLTVNQLPTVVISASPYLNLTEGMTTTLTAVATPASSIFSWFKNGTLIPAVTTNTINVPYSDTGIYRATVVDVNGCTNKSNEIKIGDSTVNLAFIYPNPNAGFFYVRFKAYAIAGKSWNISMYDSKGSRVFVKDYTTPVLHDVMEVHAEKLSKAVYVLILSDASGVTLGTGKVLIQ